MKRIVGKALAVACVAAASIWAVTGPDVNDYTLVMYKLGGGDHYSATDGVLSGFWSKWDNYSRDYVSMKSDQSQYLYEVGPKFQGGDDAGLAVRAAYNEKGVYLYCDVNDNSFVEPGAPGTWGTDVVDLYMDALNKAGLENVENLFGAQWALSTSSKQLQVAMGNTAKVSSFNFRKYDAVDMLTMTNNNVPFGSGIIGDCNYDSINCEIITVSATRKIQEWYIPWSQWLGEGGAMPAVGTRLAFIAGYNDQDGDAAGQTKSLRWREHCDPYCGISKGLPTWGEVEVGDFLDPADVGVLKPMVKNQRNSVAGQAEYFTVRGEKISAARGLKASNLVVKRVLNNKTTTQSMTVIR